MLVISVFVSYVSSQNGEFTIITQDCYVCIMSLREESILQVTLVHVLH